MIDSRLSVARLVSSKLGSGMARMDQACKAKNIPKPYYEVRPGGVAIVFRFKDINNESNSNQNCELDCESDCELKLTDRQKVILSISMSDGEKTASWIASQLQVGFMLVEVPSVLLRHLLFYWKGLITFELLLYLRLKV